MKTISVQQLPNGFEIEPPSFGYWFKAGAAFTLGGGLVTVIAMTLWGILGLGILAGIGAAVTPATHHELRDTRTLPR